MAALAERLTALRDAEAEAVRAVGAAPLRRRVETDETHREVYEALEDNVARREYLASLIDRVSVERGSRPVRLRERVQIEYAPSLPPGPRNTKDSQAASREAARHFCWSAV